MIELGWNACLRRRNAPSTRYDGSVQFGSCPISPACGVWIGNALWRMMM